MAEVSKEAGIVAVLVKRMTEDRLPRALAIKERVDRGEKLNDLDLSFFQQVLDDAAKMRSVVNDPKAKELGARVLQLYNEITQKALENEKAKK